MLDINLHMPSKGPCVRGLGLQNLMLMDIGLKVENLESGLLIHFFPDL